VIGGYIISIGGLRDRCSLGVIVFTLMGEAWEMGFLGSVAGSEGRSEWCLALLLLTPPIGSRECSKSCSQSWP
jgi:hypothetical protein